MKRTLTLSMLLSLSAASPLVLALGLGDAQVGSTIDSPLRATVPLLEAPADMDPGRIKVTLASAGAFEAAGMILTPAARSVRAEVRRRNGALVLDLASQSPVTDPWLDLLLEFQMPDGRRDVRELTLLLDPPGYGDHSTLVRAAGQSAGDAPVASADAGSSARPSAPGPVISPGRSRSGAAAPAADGYGVTSTVIRRGDTLWSLAEKMRPGRDVTIEQTIVALVKSNPQAFPTGNANVMAAGATLRLPPRDALTAQAHADAVRQLSIMERAWMGAGASGLAPGRASSGADDADPAASAEDAGALARQTEMAVQAAEAARQAAAASSSEPSDQGTRLTLLTDTQTQADIDRLLASGGEGMQVQVAPSVLNAVVESGASEEVVRARRLERLEELEQKWQENQRVLSAIRAERDALRDEVVNLRDQITQLRIQVEKLVAHQQNQGLMPALSNMYEGALERPLVLGGSALAALLFLLALARRRPRERDSLKREAVGVQAPEMPSRAPAQPGPEQARACSRGEDFHSTVGASAAAFAGQASSGKKPHGAAGAEAASDDFEARVQQLSAAASADKTDEPRTAVFEVPESPEQEPASADARAWTEASEDAAAGKPAVIDYQPVKADASAATRAASDEDAAPHKPEKNASVEYQAPAFDHRASIDYQAPSLEKTQAHAADAADKSESLEQPVVDFAPRSAPDDASQARAVDAAFGEPSVFCQSALPEGFKVEVVEYPLHDSSSAAPADETLEKDC